MQDEGQDRRMELWRGESVQDGHVRREGAMKKKKRKKEKRTPAGIRQKNGEHGISSSRGQVTREAQALLSFAVWLPLLSFSFSFPLLSSPLLCFAFLSFALRSFAFLCLLRLLFVSATECQRPCFSSRTLLLCFSPCSFACASIRTPPLPSCPSYQEETAAFCVSRILCIRQISGSV